VSITTPGTYPDSLPHATVGNAYSETLQVRVLTDTVIIVLGTPVTATVDSILVESVSGLPSGFSYTCTPSNCHFPGGSNGCVLLQGTAPTIGMVGTYPIVVYITT